MNHNPMSDLKDFLEREISLTNENFIEWELLPFLRIPSYTINSKGILEAKNFLLDYIKDFASETKEFIAGRNPLILAKVDGNSKQSLLIYMMYDTQPVSKPSDWIGPPFGAEVRTLPDLTSLGKCVIARGAYNSKTPLIAFLNIIKILKVHEALPITLYLLFDGEEEIGSPTLLKYIKMKKFTLPKCLGSFYPSAKQSLSKKAIVKLGYKGILSFTLKLETLNKTLHSSYNSIIPNAAMLLINLITRIYDGEKFKINCLSAEPIISDEDSELIKKLMNEIDFNDFLSKIGIESIPNHDFKDLFLNYLYKPSFNISTLKSGYMGSGIQNTIPNVAECVVDIRFANEVSINTIFREINTMVNEFSLLHAVKITLSQNVGYEGSRIDQNSALTRSLITSFEKVGVSTQLWPFSAAAAPLSVIKKELGLDFLVGGLGIGGNAHAPNEFIQIDSLLPMRLAFYYFFKFFSTSFD